MCDLFGLALYMLMLLSLQISIVKKRPLYLFISMFFVVLISSHRGLAGVDTHLYILRYDNVEQFTNIGVIEPLIPILMSITKFANGNFQDFSFFYGLVVSLLYLFIFKKFPNAIYFGLTMFPVIFVDSLFNGVRVGLAYPLMFLAITYSSIIFFILAVSSHISSLIICGFKIIPYKYIFIFILIILIFFSLSDLTVFDLLPDRYISKFYDYQEMYTANIYSGTADSFLLFISLLIYLRVLGIKGKSFLIKSFYIFVLVSAFHILLVSKYVFMLRIVRILDIAVFALIAKNKNKTDKFALYLSLLVGIIYILNFLRQISSTCSYNIGGFLPLNLGLL